MEKEKNITAQVGDEGSRAGRRVNKMELPAERTPKGCWVLGWQSLAVELLWP